MNTFSRLRFWLETLMATITGALFFVSLLWRDWIETVFGVDPDQHSGAEEWLIVAVLLAVTVVLSVAARGEWRKPRTVTA